MRMSFVSRVTSKLMLLWYKEIYWLRNATFLSSNNQWFWFFSFIYIFIDLYLYTSLYIERGNIQSDVYEIEENKNLFKGSWSFYYCGKQVTKRRSQIQPRCSTLVYNKVMKGWWNAQKCTSDSYLHSCIDDGDYEHHFIYISVNFLTGWMQPY